MESGSGGATEREALERWYLTMSSRPNDDSGDEEGDIFTNWEEEEIPSADDPGWSWNDGEDNVEDEGEESTVTDDRIGDEAGSGSVAQNDSSPAGSNVVAPANVPTEAVEMIRAEEEALSKLADSELPAGDIAAELLAIIERKDRFD